MNRGPDSWTAFSAEARRARGRTAGRLQDGSIVDVVNYDYSRSQGLPKAKCQRPLTAAASASAATG